MTLRHGFRLWTEAIESWFGWGFDVMCIEPLLCPICRKRLDIWRHWHWGHVVSHKNTFFSIIFISEWHVWSTYFKVECGNIILNYFILLTIFKYSVFFKTVVTICLSYIIIIYMLSGTTKNTLTNLQSACWPCRFCDQWTTVTKNNAPRRTLKIPLFCPFGRDIIKISMYCRTLRKYLSEKFQNITPLKSISFRTLLLLWFYQDPCSESTLDCSRLLRFHFAP